VERFGWWLEADGDVLVFVDRVDLFAICESSGDSCRTSTNRFAVPNAINKQKCWLTKKLRFVDFVIKRTKIDRHVMRQWLSLRSDALKSMFFKIQLFPDSGRKTAAVYIPVPSIPKVGTAILSDFSIFVYSFRLTLSRKDEHV